MWLVRKNIIQYTFLHAFCKYVNLSSAKPSPKWHIYNTREKTSFYTVTVLDLSASSPILQLSTLNIKYNYILRNVSIKHIIISYNNLFHVLLTWWPVEQTERVIMHSPCCDVYCVDVFVCCVKFDVHLQSMRHEFCQITKYVE